MEKYRILIVDDDTLVLELMRHAARRHPQLDVDATTDASAAVEKIRTSEQPYHIILSDLVMPKFSGLDVLRAARMRSPDSRGIIVTGFGDKESTAEAIKLGVADYLRKPFRREELERAFRNAIEHFDHRKNLMTLEEKHTRLTQANQEQQERLVLLDAQIRELTTRLDRHQTDERAARNAEAAITLAKNAKRDDVQRYAMMRQLHDLDRLFKTRAITEEEFQSVRKSLIEKVYKKII